MYLQGHQESTLLLTQWIQCICRGTRNQPYFWRNEFSVSAGAPGINLTFDAMNSVYLQGHQESTLLLMQWIQCICRGTRNQPYFWRNEFSVSAGAPGINLTFDAMNSVYLQGHQESTLLLTQWILVYLQGHQESTLLLTQWIQCICRGTRNQPYFWRNEFSVSAGAPGINLTFDAMNSVYLQGHQESTLLLTQWIQCICRGTRNQPYFWRNEFSVSAGAPGINLTFDAMNSVYLQGHQESTLLLTQWIQCICRGTRNQPYFWRNEFSVSAGAPGINLTFDAMNSVYLQGHQESTLLLTQWIQCICRGTRNQPYFWRNEFSVSAGAPGINLTFANMPDSLNHRNLVRLICLQFWSSGNLIRLLYRWRTPMEISMWVNSVCAQCAVIAVWLNASKRTQVRMNRSGRRWSENWRLQPISPKVRKFEGSWVRRFFSSKVRKLEKKGSRVRTKRFEGPEFRNHEICNLFTYKILVRNLKTTASLKITYGAI